MALNLYRRHRLECEAKRPEESRTGEFEERAKGWKKCGCVIFVSGTLGGKFKRRQTGKNTWDEAKVVTACWESANSWDGEVSPPPAQADAPARSVVTVERAVAAFLADRTKVSAPNTQLKFKLILKKLTSYSESKGYVLLSQWTPIDVREFRASWSVGANTASKNMTVVRSFFQFCVSNEWLERSPAALVKEIRSRSDGRNIERIPFSDDELKRMFEACETKYGMREIKWSRDVHHRPVSGVTANYKYRWTGRDMADFISVSVYTGLRISDVCTFHIDRLQDSGECHIRTTKTGRKVYTWIPQWLQDRIRARVAEHGPLIFGAHQTTNMNVVTDIWRRKLNRLWSLCGPWPQKPTPHRFRHTFARILLQKEGVTVRDVAELMGDTEAMVLKHYSAWVNERQARLTKLLRDAFEEKPTPKLDGTLEVPVQEAGVDAPGY